MGVVLCLASLLVIDQLDVSFNPQSQSQYFTLSFDYANHPPRVVEEEVTSLLENQLSQLEGLKQIYSRSKYGSGEIQLVFPPEADLAFREIEIHSLLRQLKSQLPPEMLPPRVSRKSNKEVEESPLLIYEFTYANEDLDANEWLHHYLIPRVAASPAIDRIEAVGSQRFAWKIQFDPVRLARLKLTRNQIIESLRSQFRQLELGFVASDKSHSPVFIHTIISSKQALEMAQLTDQVQLSDVANIQLAPDLIRSHQRINGEKAIFINCYAHDGSNRIQVADQINQFIQSFASELPTDYHIRLNYDDTAYLKKELNKTWTRAILSILIIMLFIFLSSFSWRYLTVLLGSICVSLAITILFSWAFEIALHLYTLAGLSIAMGILVDNTIVLLDHLKKRKNLSIISAQLASSITTVISLSVIWLLPSESRDGLGDFGLVICAALSASFLTSIFFSPALSSVVNHAHELSRKHVSFRLKRKRYKSLGWLQNVLCIGLKVRLLVLCIFIMGFGLPIYLLPPSWEGQQWYNQSIGSDYYQDYIRSPLNKWLGGSLRMFHKEVYESSSYRSPEKTRLQLSATLPYGQTIEQMNEILSSAEEYLMEFKEIDKFITRIYSGRYGSITIEFIESAEQSGFPFKLKDQLVQRSLLWGGVDWNLYGVGKGFSNASNETLPGFQLALKGYQFEALEQYAETIKEELLKHKRIQEVNTNSQLHWSEESLTLYRFRPDIKHQETRGYKSTLQYLNSHSMQQYPSLYLNYRDRDFPVYVESSDSDQISIYNTLNTGSNQVPLAYFGNLEREKTINAIHKKDRQYLRNISYEFLGSHQQGSDYLDEVIEQVQAKLPPGFTVERQVWSWKPDQEKRKYELFLFMMLGIFLISTIFLESIKKGLLVTLIIPLSFIGLFLTFGWGKFSFDQGGYAAFLMIGGLSVNALLYILSDYRQFLKKYEPHMAMTRAISQKAWPIFLTVLSTCCGLIPFLIHGDGEVFWFSFAVGTIGGLLFSLVVVFGLMPILILPKNLLKTSTVSSKN